MLKISVVVVCFNERQNIQECMDSILRNNYSSENYELLIVDNESTDGTKEVIQDYEKQHSNVRLLSNPIVGIAGSRNLGLKNAQYEYVAYTDADCIVRENWLQTLSAGFEKYGIDNQKIVGVGGSNVPPQDSSHFYSVLRTFLTTYLGSHGSVQGMTFSADKKVGHIPTINVLYHKKKLLEVAGFDVTFGNIGEDQDLSYRFNKKGYQYYYLANNQVYHKLRSNFRKWTKNMYVYGKGRMWLMRKHPQCIKPVLLAPFFLVALLPLSLFAFFVPLLALPLLYFPAIFLISLLECAKRKSISLSIGLFCIYVGTLIAYGIGQWYGLFKNREFYREKL